MQSFAMPRLNVGKRAFLKASIYVLAIVALSCGLSVVLALYLGQPFSRYQTLAYREYESPTADDGFSGLGAGIRGTQTFYWDEITSSKAFDLELLREMGEGVSYPYSLPSLVADKFLEAEKRRSVDGLFLILYYPNLVDTKDSASGFGPEALESFHAAEAAFLRLVSARGASLKPVGPIRYHWEDRWLSSENILFYARIAFPAALSAALLAAFFLNRRIKNARPIFALGRSPESELSPSGEAAKPQLAASRPGWRRRLVSGPASFGLGLMAAGIVVWILIQVDVLGRPRDSSEEPLAVFGDPKLRERMVKQVEEFQNDLLSTKLQALAVRADFALLLLSDPAVSAPTLRHGVVAIAQFLNSESDWNANDLTYQLTEPILRPTREKVMTLLKSNPSLKQQVESYQQELLTSPEPTGG